MDRVYNKIQAFVSGIYLRCIAQLKGMDCLRDKTKLHSQLMHMNGTTNTQNDQHTSSYRCDCIQNSTAVIQNVMVNLRVYACKFNCWSNTNDWIIRHRWFASKHKSEYDAYWCRRRMSKFLLHKTFQTKWIFRTKFFSYETITVQVCFCALTFHEVSLVYSPLLFVKRLK